MPLKMTGRSSKENTTNNVSPESDCYVNTSSYSTQLFQVANFCTNKLLGQPHHEIKPVRLLKPHTKPHIVHHDQIVQALPIFIFCTVCNKKLGRKEPGMRLGDIISTNFVLCIPWMLSIHICINALKCCPGALQSLSWIYHQQRAISGDSTSPSLWAWIPWHCKVYSGIESWYQH